MLKNVGDPISTKNKANSWYISGDNPHLTNQFCKVELDLNSLFNMVYEYVVAKIDGPIWPPPTNIYSPVL